MRFHRSLIVLTTLTLLTSLQAQANGLRWIASAKGPINRCDALMKVDPEKIGMVREEFLAKFDKKPTFEIPYTSAIRDQCSWGSCWDFGFIAKLETSIKKYFNVEFDLSESYGVGHSIRERIKTAIMEPGAHLIQGGHIDTAAWIAQTHGIVPESVWKPRTQFYDKAISKRFEILVNTRLSEHYGKLDSIITKYKTQAQNTADLTSDQVEVIQKAMRDEMNVAANVAYGDLTHIVDAFVGPPIEKFKWTDGVEYTPISFAQKFMPAQEGTIIKIYPERKKLPPLLDNVTGVTEKPIRPVIGRSGAIEYNLDAEGLARGMDEPNPYSITVPASEALDMLKAEIDQGVAVPFAFEVSGAFMSTETGIVSIAAFHAYDGFEMTTQMYRSKFGQFEGGHMVAATGYKLDKDGKVEWIKFKNSWGEKAGDKGFYYMHRDYFENYFLEMYRQGKMSVAPAAEFKPGNRPIRPQLRNRARTRATQPAH